MNPQPSREGGLNELKRAPRPRRHSSPPNSFVRRSNLGFRLPRVLLHLGLAPVSVDFVCHWHFYNNLFLRSPKSIFPLAFTSAQNATDVPSRHGSIFLQLAYNILSTTMHHLCITAGVKHLLYLRRQHCSTPASLSGNLTYCLYIRQYIYGLCK